MLVYKNLHGLAPGYLLHEFSHARDFHSYNTHHGNLLRLLLAWTTKYQGSFRFSRVKIWNTLPLALRSEHDLNKFGFGPKRHFRSKPNRASNTLATLSCSNFLCCFVFFSFRQCPIQTSLAIFDIMKNYVPKSTHSVNKWAMKIFGEWQVGRRNKKAC